MHLKRYRSATVREALALARADLGPGALVLSTRLVGSSGWRGWLGGREVEVAAATERNVSADRPATTQARQPQETHGRAELIAKLQASGLDATLASEIASMVPGARRRGASPASIRQALANRLATLAAGDEPQEAIEVFVGPPGVGKTTTIAKIAAQARARGGARLSLVAADGYRVGAVEQLRLYADIIGSPFIVGRTASDVERAMTGTRSTLLIDTAGRSPGDPIARELFELVANRPSVRTHLVLAAGTSVRDAERIFERYRPAKPGRVILTKLDETDSVCPLIGVLREHELPISYLGTGQRVPEDLERACPATLAARVLGEPLAAAGRTA